jgi:HEAT repeat protein
MAIARTTLTVVAMLLIANRLGASGDKPNLAGLLKALDHADAKVRARAAARLSKYGPRAKAAVPALIDALDDEENVRKEAIGALIAIGEDGLGPMFRAFDQQSLEIQLEIVDVLYFMGQRAKPAVPGLVKLLAHKRPEVRLRAIGALGQIRDEACIPALIKTLEMDPYYDVRRYAASELGSFRERAKPAVRFLVKAMRDSTDLSDRLKRITLPEEKRPTISGLLAHNSLANRAAVSLIQIGKPAIPNVLKLLKDKDWVMRYHAALILGGMEGNAAGAVPQLTASLSDRDPDVRAEIAWALGKIGPNAKPALPLLNKRMRDKAPLVQVRAAVAIRQIDRKDSKALGVLVALLKHADADVRSKAVIGLGEVGHNEKAVVLALGNAAIEEDDEYVQTLVIWELGSSSENEWAAPILISGLKNRKASIRQRAAKALRAIRHVPRVVPALIMALEDPDADVRVHAAESLAYRGKEALPAIPALKRRLQDENADVRMAAEKALYTLPENESK